ncbi:transcriptional regulator, GntR family [Roseovarius azorensis]|uniref:Transcriptional regulator, GntR family n=1 Tax=Roseovarius azorensis TaxID=1287727 RepID=A0A1H7X450_9RHOB|nr:transcriptional regulator NanR [Roseovarius azorensis]SEM28652.1 transcriptional regulator, GntR family [Roseovarius azorensis]
MVRGYPSDTRDASDSPDDQIVRQKLSDQIFDRLWRMIKSGELAPGDLMPSERALMERFKVGRPAVREALQSLANKGLISISHGERSRVNMLTPGVAVGQIDALAKLMLSSEPSTLEHLKQVRLLLETASARLAVPACGTDEIAELRGLVTAQRAQLGHEKAFIQCDIAFHCRIAALTGNPIILAVTEAMLAWLFDYYKPLLLWSGREETTLREHDRIVDFLETQNADEVERMMHAHLTRADALYQAGTG